jgi:hypothetical protein
MHPVTLAQLDQLPAEAIAFGPMAHDTGSSTGLNSPCGPCCSAACCNKCPALLSYCARSLSDSMICKALLWYVMVKC